MPYKKQQATQILNTLAKSTYEEILTIATDPESDTGQAYAILKSLFDHTKKVYSITEPFLSPYLLGSNTEQAHIDTIRKANLATFVSSVFGSQDVGFYHLNEYFLDTFVADGSRLLKSQAQLFLDLKTQAYISALSHGERLREEILEDLFPVDLEQRLLSRRPGAKQLAPSEAEFLQRARNRSRALLEEPMTQEVIAALPQKYIWEDFLRDISAYVSKNFVTIVGTPVSHMHLLSLCHTETHASSVNLYVPVVPTSSLQSSTSSGNSKVSKADNSCRILVSKTCHGLRPRYRISQIPRSLLTLMT